MIHFYNFKSELPVIYDTLIKFMQQRAVCIQNGEKQGVITKAEKGLHNQRINNIS